MVVQPTDARPDADRLRGSFALVDLETTGGNAAYHRVIEVGIVTYEEGRVVEEWSALVNPGVVIPAGIERFTGITNAMVRDAPAFAAISAEIRKRLDERTFVAHNVRFDHGFLRAEFRRVGERLAGPRLCTVRLSRLLYPDQASHRLDAVMERHGLACSARHRALGDARVLADFLDRCVAIHGRARIEAAIARLSAGPALPPQLPPELADELPEGPGVYRFFGAGGTLLYVGKSTNIRTRVLQHFAAEHRRTGEQALSRLVTRVEWTETAGELGALLLEQQLVKSLRPTRNRRLRASDAWWTIRLETSGSSLRPIVEDLTVGEVDSAFGLFRSPAEARRVMERVVRDAGLCLRALGLESGTGSCFGYQIGRCRGACAGNEPLALHDARVRLAFAGLRLRAWPFAGAIGIRERGMIGEQIHVFDDWRYLGSVSDDDELAAVVHRPRDADFDGDVYRIIGRALARRVGGVIDLARAREHC